MLALETFGWAGLGWIGLGERVGGAGEREGGGVPDEPEETLGGSVLLGLELVPAEILDVLGLAGGRELPFADFLHRPLATTQTLDPTSWQRELTLTLPSMSFLTGAKATEPRTSDYVSSDFR